MKKASLGLVSLMIATVCSYSQTTYHQVSGSEAGDMAIQYMGSETWDYRLPWVDVDDLRMSAAAWANPDASAGSCNIAMGIGSVAEGFESLACGGHYPWATGTCATAIGGTSLQVAGNCSAAVGGYMTSISGLYASVIGGSGNEIFGGNYSAILGGQNNGVGAMWSTISGGGNNNIYIGDGEFIAGGNGNTIYGVAWNNGFNTVGGGQYNLISNMSRCVIGGGQNNVIKSESVPPYAHTIGGGIGNMIYLTNPSLAANTIVGGYCNGMTNCYGSTISGGANNSITGAYESVVSGGAGNTVYGSGNGIASGAGNVVTGQYSAVAGGNNNRAVGTCATVLGGYYNVATGSYSVAAGYRAAALQGSFVFAGATSGLTNSAINQFWVKAPGGTRFISNDAGTTGVELPAGGNGWNVLCDRKLKHDAKMVQSKQALEAVMMLNVETFHTDAGKDAAERPVYLGIMANEFNDALESLGADRNVTAEGYNTVDTTAAMAMSVAAIQAQQVQIKALQEEISQLRAQLAQR